MPDLPWVGERSRTRSTSRSTRASRTAATTCSSSGRFSPDKGAHRAIAVAMELGLPLKIAGKNREPKERQYFAEYVEPHLGHGGSSTSARSTHGAEGRAAPGRARDALPDRVGGAVRPRDDRVDGVRDAGDRDPPRRGARGDRGRAERGDRRQLPRDGRGSRPGRRARPDRVPALRRGALRAGADGAATTRTPTGPPCPSSA